MSFNRVQLKSYLGTEQSSSLARYQDGYSWVRGMGKISLDKRMALIHTCKTGTLGSPMFYRGALVKLMRCRTVYLIR